MEASYLTIRAFSNLAQVLTWLFDSSGGMDYNVSIVDFEGKENASAGDIHLEEGARWH
jgi:hypothetical protein